VLGPASGWGDREELLAAAVDWLGHIDYLLRAAHFKGHAEPPTPVPRPGRDDLDGEPASFGSLG
jgi:hypothetical protein